MALVGLGLLSIWVGIDLWGPRSHDLRDFDPAEVGRLDSEMWRSYYEKRRLQLFLQLGQVLREQYGLPRLRSYVTALNAARSAVVFQRGHNRAEYDRALPPLRRFYDAIARVSATKFDPERAARLELEWWIVHRERAMHAPGDLPQALADLQGELFGLPAARFLGHARERAEAMLLRDEAAAAPDWLRIEQKLRRSWTLLWQEVHPGVRHGKERRGSIIRPCSFAESAPKFPLSRSAWTG
jgi:hypothetical protein